MKLLLLLERSLLLLFWVLLIFGFDMTHTAILTIISALIHELGHIVCLMIVSSNKIYMPIPDISGFRISIPKMSYKKELLSALSGPLANLVCAIICFSLSAMSHSFYFKSFGILNIMTMLSNLLPIENWDGYKILNAIFGLAFKQATHFQTVLYWLSFTFSSALTFIALYIMLKSGEGYWVFALFFTVLLRSIIKKQKGNVF